MAVRLRFGTSGWDYDEWIGPFYGAAGKSKLAAYARVFDTVEINSTFYRAPAPGMVRGWSRNSPDDFVFAAKVPQTVTHDRRLDVEQQADADARAFSELMTPLRDAGKLGPLLLQLPPSLRFQPATVGRFFETLDPAFTWAIEFRNRTWLRPEAYDLLRSHGIVYTIVDEPLLPPDAFVTAPSAYIRWHGKGTDPWYDYRYSDNELRAWVPRVQAVADKSSVVFGFFNNHYHGYAPENCLQVLEMLGASTDEGREAARHIEAFRRGDVRGVGPAKAVTLDDFDADHAARAGVERALLRLVDAARLDRGKRIEASEVEIVREGDEVNGRVSDYVVSMNASARILLHNCDDWAKQIAAKRMCKHLARFFLSLPPHEARGVLEDLASRREDWTFRTPEA